MNYSSSPARRSALVKLPARYDIRSMPALTDLVPHAPIIALLIGVLVIGALVRRIPILGTLISMAIWLVLLVGLVLVLGQRERFDPYVGRIAEMLDLHGQDVVGEEVRIRMSPDGHFWARARFGGVERRMLIDSGATLTALSVDTAAAAGLAVRDELFPVMLRTANGTIRARTSAIGEMRLGNVVARDLPVVVSPAFGDANILGMNFLSRLKSWRVEDNVLILTPHHPQDITS